MFREVPKLIFGDLRLKGVALAIAVAVWFYASGRLKEEAGVFAPLVLTVPEGYRIVHQSEHRMQLRISGPRSLIARLRDVAAQNQLRLITPLTPEQLQRRLLRLEVKPEWLEVKDWLDMSKQEFMELRVATIQPEVVSVYASEMSERSLPVEVQLSGEPYPGYEVAEAVPIPTEVTASGPAILLEKLSAVQTRDVPVWNLRADQRLEVALLTQQRVQLEPDLEIPLSLECSPARVAVSIRVRAARAERTLEGIPVELLEPPGFPYEAEIPEEYATVSVIVTGMEEKLAKLTPASVTAYVHLKALSEENIEAGRSAPYKENVRVLLPPEMTDVVARPEPNIITVTLTNPAP